MAMLVITRWYIFDSCGTPNPISYRSPRSSINPPSPGILCFDHENEQIEVQGKTDSDVKAPCDAGRDAGVAMPVF